MEITCVVDARAELGEGTLWDPEAACSGGSTSGSKQIHRYDPATGKDDTWSAPEYPRLPRSAREGRAGALPWSSGFYFFDPATGGFEPIADPEAHLPHTRFNDGKPDRQGRFWSGTMFEVPGRPVAVHRLALPHGHRPVGAPDDRGRRLLQRARLEPRQQDHVLLRQPHRRSSAPTTSTRPPATSRTCAPSSTSRTAAASPTAPPSTRMAATGSPSRSPARSTTTTRTAS